MKRSSGPYVIRRVTAPRGYYLHHRSPHPISPIRLTVSVPREEGELRDSIPSPTTRGLKRLDGIPRVSAHTFHHTRRFSCQASWTIQVPNPLMKVRSLVALVMGMDFILDLPAEFSSKFY